MTHREGVAHGRDVVARWCALAEQRLEHLTELFETGRWRRYHSERAFLENIPEARSAVEIWRDLSMREASRDNSAIDMSWLGHTQATLLRGDAQRDRVDRVQPPPARTPAEPPPRDIPQQVLAALESELVASDESPSAPDLDAGVPAAAVLATPELDEPALDNASVPTLDVTTIQERYPLLRNAL